MHDLHVTGATGAAVSNAISGGSFGTSVQAGTIHGGVHVHHQPPPRLVPMQLPPVPVHFTNRTSEVGLLDRAWDASQGNGAPALVLLSGPGGAGKTALASTWAGLRADRFADGQLYADLGGFRPEQPVEVTQVLGGFLRALGVAPDEMPITVEEQGSLFRSLTARSRLLILLDNVTSAAQVAALMPGSAGGMVVVTSRLRLAGILARGGTLVEVASLTQDHAVELLERAVGRTVEEAEAQQLSDLAGLCAGLPLALRAAGARLAARPRWPVGRMVRELADEQRRLAALSVDEGMSVTSVFDLSFRGLSPAQARAYRRLSLHPGRDFGPATAAAVVELPPDETSDVLEALVDASVLEDMGVDRYRFHDLVRLHARERAAEEGGDAEARAVLECILGQYLRVAVAVDRAVMPGEWHVGPAYVREGRTETVSASAGETLDTLEDELPNIMAVLRAASDRAEHAHEHEREREREHGHELDQLIWQLCEAMWSLFLYRKHFPDWIAAYGMGIAAADRCGDPAAKSRMYHRRGLAFHNLRRREEARADGRAALEAARAAGHEPAESAALQLLGIAARASGRYDEAIETLGRAAALDRRAGQVRSEALAQRLLGSAHQAAGHIGPAVDALERSVELAAGLSDPPVLAMSRVYLAEALTRAGRADEALELARAAWAVMEDSGSRQYRAVVMMAWGQAAEGTGDLATARQRLLSALDHFTEAGVPDLRPVRTALDRVEAALSTDSREPPIA
ncbi:NB-ARC domain-containing protein [Streptomyces sp. NPDC006529]|uniref:NB-ARC domain-containing protein n=1 Tax=Streptomyces sp. NPDC006529 TaxID=3157177 RepID=UPI00339F6A3F